MGEEVPKFNVGDYRLCSRFGESGFMVRLSRRVNNQEGPSWYVIAEGQEDEQGPYAERYLARLLTEMEVLAFASRG